jgi:hypothetical protein
MRASPPPGKYRKVQVNLELHVPCIRDGLACDFYGNLDVSDSLA